LPHKCQDGFCVEQEQYCDDVKTGCPHNEKYKCHDGSCVSDLLQCPEAKCPEGKTLCADGSCMVNAEACPNIMGCLGDKYRCSNGDCVDIEEGETCPVNTCPKEAPYKCLDGMCAITWSFCPSIIQLPTES
jgi:hypothetical protein